MTTPGETEIMTALKAVQDPDRGADIVSLGMVSGLVNRDGNVGFTIEVDAARGAALEPLRKAAEKAVEAVPGVLSVTAVLTAPTAPPAAAQSGASPPTAPPAAAQSGGASPPGAPPTAQSGAPPGATPRAPGPAPGGGDKLLLPEVDAVVAVASGKGGVGKSTTAVNMALALSAAGSRVGMLDADIYGPSMPMMLGIHERPSSPDGKTLIPIEKFGLKCMSIGFMVPEDTPMIWRGPMVMGALEQMLGDVLWGALDILVVDMPPGTGDAQLTMAQRVPLAGAVIVSTPQDLSLLDARKGLNMFRKVDVPVLGIVENMSYFVCPHCGERSEIFKHGGARRAAETMGVDFLGEIPLDMAIREGGDTGRPIMVSDPDSPLAAAYREIAEAVREKVSGPRTAGPRIVVQ